MNGAFPYFDGHCDTLTLSGEPSVRIGEERFSKRGQIFAVCDDRGVQKDLTYFRRALSRLAELPDVMLCRDGTEIRSANANGKIAAVIDIEGAGIVNYDPELLDGAYELGARVLGLTHNRYNGLVGSCVEEPEQGLTEAGRTFAAHAIALNMVLDISHMSDRGAAELLELPHAHVIASHSNARAVCDHPRNLPDALFLQLIRHKGVCGLNLYDPFVRSGGGAALEDVVRHADHFLSLDPHAEYYLALGCDFDGCDVLAGGLRATPQLDALAEEFLRRNYPEDLVENLFYYNLFRCLCNNLMA